MFDIDAYERRHRIETRMRIGFGFSTGLFITVPSLLTAPRFLIFGYHPMLIMVMLQLIALVLAVISWRQYRSMKSGYDAC